MFQAAVWNTRRIKSWAVITFILLTTILYVTNSSSGQNNRDPVTVLGYSELGMHFLNADYSELALHPPGNTLRAQVIDRSSGEPRIVTSGVTVSYLLPSNTHSADKNNFWLFAQRLFGVQLQPNYGLTGNTLSGTMKATSNNDWEASDIPVTPISDEGRDDPYPLALITVSRNGQVVGQTRAVVPVSSEISCNLCHVRPGVSTATDILRKHDRLHNTHLEDQKPVLCANCHADYRLGMTGRPDLPSLSQAMHRAHAPRVAAANLSNSCYACHPGFRTQALRDVHFSKGLTCTNCHGTMETIASSNRRPWVDEPRCSNCHQRAGFEFEEPGKLFRDSRGHMTVHCAACHGSPHAITPTVTAADNLQALALQGHPGKINDCTVCHLTRPDDAFPHRLSGN